MQLWILLACLLAGTVSGRFKSRKNVTLDLAYLLKKQNKQISDSEVNFYK